MLDFWACALRRRCHPRGQWERERERERERESERERGEEREAGRAGGRERGREMGSRPIASKYHEGKVKKDFEKKGKSA